MFTFEVSGALLARIGGCCCCMMSLGVDRPVMLSAMTVPVPAETLAHGEISQQSQCLFTLHRCSTCGGAGPAAFCKGRRLQVFWNRSRGLELRLYLCTLLGWGVLSIPCISVRVWMLIHRLV